MMRYLFIFFLTVSRLVRIFLNVIEENNIQTGTGTSGTLNYMQTVPIIENAYITNMFALCLFFTIL